MIEVGKNADPKRILLVEDDLESLKLFGTILENAGFSVTPSHDGETATELLKKERFDLVSLDVLLPNIDGFALLKNIRSTPLTRNLPVIIVSGRSGMADTFLAIGADCFIEKPLEMHKYIDEIRNLTQKKALLIAESPSIIEKTSKILEKFNYDVSVVENEEEMVKNGTLARYKCVMAHICCVSSPPEKFKTMVSSMLKYKDPLLVLLSDSEVKGLEKDNAVAIEKEKVRWARAGINTFYDSRVSVSSLSSCLRNWLPQG